MTPPSQTAFDLWVQGIGTTEAAKRLKCSEATISLLRRGKRKPSLEMAYLILNVAAIGMAGWTR